jgi:hypothetical protein
MPPADESHEAALGKFAVPELLPVTAVLLLLYTEATILEWTFHRGKVTFHYSRKVTCIPKMLRYYSCICFGTLQSGPEGPEIWA